ncbi:MAG: dicarboxylate/amino acid:cation symporter [Puniceicoccales bacterium]|jgi:Na+/H+-dicarboxylate symporter|nr:dicarboxylate/amino acid:cation symporter [Puniceicoccales bacterium]
MRLSSPVLLVFLFIAVYFFGTAVPLPLQRGLLALSITLKSFVICLLPFLIFGLLFSAFYRLGRVASRTIFWILVLVCSSNFLAVYVSQFFGRAVYAVNLGLSSLEAGRTLEPLFLLQFPRLIPNSLALVSGVLAGIFAAKFFRNRAMALLTGVDGCVAKLLRCVLALVPFFLVGFLLKMKYDGLLAVIVRRYAAIAVLIVVAVVAYLFLFYYVASGFNFRRTASSLRHMLSPAICAFSSMSSAATLPYTLVAVEKNCANGLLARSMATTTSNIHLIGDCFAIPIFIYAILSSYGFPPPPAALYFFFAVQFVVAKFSVAGVPAGGIIVMLPIIERCFGFHSEMSSLIFSLYVIMDPICTCANVLGNGALAQFADRTVFRNSQG